LKKKEPRQKERKRRDFSPENSALLGRQREAYRFEEDGENLASEDDKGKHRRKHPRKKELSVKEPDITGKRGQRKADQSSRPETSRRRINRATIGWRVGF